MIRTAKTFRRYRRKWAIPTTLIHSCGRGHKPGQDMILVRGFPNKMVFGSPAKAFAGVRDLT